MAWVLAVALVIVGVIGTVLPALPGPILVFAGVFVAAWADGFHRIGVWTLILLGLFQTKLAIALIAFTGVAMASVYMLRMFIRAMHNRQPATGVESREISIADAVVIVPLVLAIIAFALYPQGALTASQPATKAAIEQVVK